MKNELIYKKATIEDIENLVSSRIQVLRTVFGIGETDDVGGIEVASRAYYQQALADNSHTAYLVYEGEQVIAAGGICYYQIMPMPYDTVGKCGFIMNMYTDERYRGQGIATNILDLLIEDAKQRDVLQFSLSSSELGKPVYEKYGFRIDDSSMIYRIR